MSLDLWKPLKINNALLQDIFNLPIDGKLSSKGKLIAHPLIIFENKETKAYYCIRLQSANKSTIKSNDYRIKPSTKNYYAYHFNKDKFLKNTNIPNQEYTKEALRNIKLCIDKEKNIINQNDFQYELDKQSSNYFISKQEENINSDNGDLDIEPLDELEQENSLYLDDFKKVKNSNVGDLEVIETGQTNQVQIDNNSLQEPNEKQKPLVHQWRKSTQKLK